MTQEEINEAVQQELKSIAEKEAAFNKKYDIKIASEIKAVKEAIQLEIKAQEEQFIKEQKEQEQLEKSLAEEALKVEQEFASSIEAQETEDIKNSVSQEDEFDSEVNYKELYPNISAIKKLKEVQVVDLGKKLGLDVDIDLKAKENDKIVIDFFTENIW